VIGLAFEGGGKKNCEKTALRRGVVEMADREGVYALG